LVTPAGWLAGCNVKYACSHSNTRNRFPWTRCPYLSNAGALNSCVKCLCSKITMCPVCDIYIPFIADRNVAKLMEGTDIAVCTVTKSYACVLCTQFLNATNAKWNGRPIQSVSRQLLLGLRLHAVSWQGVHGS